MKFSSTMHSLARVNALVVAAILAASALLPALLLSRSAHGAQLTNRYIDLSATESSGADSTEGSGRDGADVWGQDVTYTVGFTTGTTGDIGGIVIDFCDASPITGDACTAPVGFDTNSAAGLALANQTGITDFAIDASSTASKLVLTRTAASVALGTPIELDLGTTAAADGLTNPTDLDAVLAGVQDTGTFYARILTYETPAAAIAYTSLAPGAFVDDGGIAMAIANELTVTARVQEVLEFCVGTELDSPGINFAGADATDSCADVAGTNLDLGVVDANSVNTTNSEGNDGVFIVRTNALNGAVVYYKAEQESGITNGAGALRQATVECSAAITDVDDVCFNSVGTTQTVITAGTEAFGMTLKDLDITSGGATTNLSCDAEYDNDGSCGGTNTEGYAWDDSGSFDQIASSTGPTDDEKASIEFAATASPTTPTGLYTVTANYVATATY